MLFGNIFGNLEKMKSELADKKAELARKMYEGESGAGLVKVEMNGARLVTRVIVDSSLMKPEDQEMMQDLIVAATNKAYQTMEADVKQQLGAVIKDKLPNIPGLDLGEMLNNF